MSNKQTGLLVLIVLVAAAAMGFGVGCIVGASDERKSMERSAVRQGFAEWDEDDKTGEPVFRWRRELVR